jgi:hypothetical protein
MQSFLIYSNLITGGWFIITSLIMSTANIKSAIFFKVIPFFAGASLIFNGLKLLKLI